MTDDELIAAFLKSDDQAGQTLLNRHRDLVKRAVSDVLGDGVSALLVGQLFRAALRQVHRYNPAHGTFVEWLAATARTEALNHLRGQAGVEGAKAWNPALRSAVREDARWNRGRSQGTVAARLLALTLPSPGRATRSEMNRGVQWTYRILSPLILGGCLFATVTSLVIPLESAEEWVGHPLMRGGCSVLCLLFALWLSARLSRLLEWVELDGMRLRWKRLWARHVREESLADLKKLHPDGTIEFSNGRKIHFDGHAPARGADLLRSLRWWQQHGMRNAEL